LNVEDDVVVFYKLGEGSGHLAKVLTQKNNYITQTVKKPVIKASVIPKNLSQIISGSFK